MCHFVNVWSVSFFFIWYGPDELIKGKLSKTTHFIFMIHEYTSLWDKVPFCSESSTHYLWEDNSSYQSSGVTGYCNDKIWPLDESWKIKNVPVSSSIDFVSILWYKIHKNIESWSIMLKLWFGIKTMNEKILHRQTK